MQTQTLYLFFPHNSTGLSCQAEFCCVRLSARSTWSDSDKGMWSVKEKLLKLFLASWCSPVSRLQTSDEIRPFYASSQLTSLSPSPVQLQSTHGGSEWTGSEGNSSEGTGSEGTNIKGLRTWCIWSRGWSGASAAWFPFFKSFFCLFILFVFYCMTLVLMK